jgi:hypothetical protein
MTSIALAFLIVNAIMIVSLPLRWAPLPLIIGACYMTLGQGFEIGPFSFSVFRLLILSGIARVIIRGEKLPGGMISLDYMILLWAACALFSSIFHKDPSSALTFRLGLTYNACGIYFLIRIFCRNLSDIINLYCLIAVLLLPVALEMVYEKIAVHNLFYIFGGKATPDIREGTIRANGPFAHAILAGTVGSICLPLMLCMWKKYRSYAIVGIISCATMIVTCGSSGPILSAAASIGALSMWPLRNRMSIVRWTAVLGYFALDMVMKAPAYYLMARISPIGSSTGWHRARLIQSAFKHIDEWWLGGTDYTRHWMPTGVSWSPNHTDITNYYLKMGVWGGLPLMLLFILVLYNGFTLVGKTLRKVEGQIPEFSFIIWALGASLFAIAATAISVSFFDQSFLFVYLTLAVIGSAWSCIKDETLELQNESMASEKSKIKKRKRFLFK